jgi:hypothetical protein
MANLSKAKFRAELKGLTPREDKFSRIVPIRSSNTKRSTYAPNAHELMMIQSSNWVEGRSFVPRAFQPKCEIFELQILIPRDSLEETNGLENFAYCRAAGYQTYK